MPDRLQTLGFQTQLQGTGPELESRCLKGQQGTARAGLQQGTVQGTQSPFRPAALLVKDILLVKKPSVTNPCMPRVLMPQAALIKSIDSRKLDT